MIRNPCPNGPHQRYVSHIVALRPHLMLDCERWNGYHAIDEGGLRPRGKVGHTPISYDVSVISDSNHIHRLATIRAPQRFAARLQFEEPALAGPGVYHLASFGIGKLL